LNKTVAELAHGFPVPLSEPERARWQVFYAVEAEERKREQERQQNEAKRKGGRRRGRR
jgi:hypothetical protein